MRWYDIVRFKCPTCGQALAVERGQARRGERVTCQNCNTPLELAVRGQPVRGAVDGGTSPATRVVLAD